MNKILFLLLIGILNSLISISQVQIKGVILNESGRGLDKVHIIDDKTGNGTVSDEEGKFSLQCNEKQGKLSFQALGYKNLTIPYKTKLSQLNIGEIHLIYQAVALDEITINAGLVQDENTPITVSGISARTISMELGDRPLPLAMNSIPGVFAVRQGGGSGDAEVSIRGFNQENIGVLVNGIPINGVENGLVYWSNWLGLSKAMAEVQVQKGPGYSNMAVNSVGGSINIVTKPASIQKGGSLSYQLTSYGNQNLNVSLHSGQLDNGWSISVMGSITRGNGYVDATYVRGWSYFLAISKQINKRNKLTLTAMGAPQRHGQRTLRLSNDENELYGNRFNKDWGSYNGQINNASENFYHRPFIGLNHYLTIDKNKKLANSIYFISGSGGGKWSESFNYAPTIFEYRNPSGQIDWPSIYSLNSTNENQYVLESGDTVSGYSYNVQTHFLASHIQAGLMSTYEQQLNERLSFTAGLHYRYFKSYLREEIIDLLGGKFFIEDYSWAVDGVAGRNQIMTVGDVIKVDNNAIINFLNAYALIQYKYDAFNAFISINANSNWYQRIDSYNYVNQDDKSELITKPGFDLRAGLAYKPGQNHSIYANGALVSKAPYFKYVFGNFTNVPVQNLKNENIRTVEMGYRFNNSRIQASLNGFYTQWTHVSLLSDEYVQLENNQQTRAMINGLNALHQGIEAKFQARINQQIKLGGFFLIADYRWKNNVEATLYNNENIAVDTVNVFAENLYVGGSAQQQFGLFADFAILWFFNLRAEWTYYDKLYANFSPVSRNNPNDTQQPFQLPSYQVVNVYMSFPFRIQKTNGIIQVNAYNLLNSNYIEWGEDGSGHDLGTFRGFWSFGRTFDFMLKFNF